MVEFATLKETLSWKLTSFRPSDRRALLGAFHTDEDIDEAYEAVILYVEGWENADWIEAYPIERIGKWLGENAPQNLITSLRDWALKNDSDARNALITGLNKTSRTH